MNAADTAAIQQVEAVDTYKDFGGFRRKYSLNDYFANILRASATPREISLADFVRDPERLSATS